MLYLQHHPRQPAEIDVPKFFSGWDTEKCTVSCTNTYHDVTDLVNYVIVKNAKTWISWTEDNFSMK